MSEEEREYLLGTNEAELARLGFQHRVWAEVTFAHWERAGFAPGWTLLDLGCGPGFATLDLAALVGREGKVIAADASARFIDYLQARCRELGLGHVEPRVTDAAELDLPPSSLDGAYARWLFCFVSDPEPVVARVAAALKPGGTMAVMDYFNYPALTLAPRSAAMDRVLQAVQESWRASGGDLDIMLRLPSLMAAHGLDLVDVRPVLRTARPGSALWNWPATFFGYYVPILVERGFLQPDEAAAFRREWRERESDPSAFFCTPPMLCVVARRR